MRKAPAGSMTTEQALAAVKDYRHAHGGRKAVRWFNQVFKHAAPEDTRLLRLKAYLKHLVETGDKVPSYTGFVNFLAAYYSHELPLYSKDQLASSPLPAPDVFKALLATETAAEAITDVVDLEQLPAANDRLGRVAEQITFGDMHGNFLKLSYCLIREGVLEGIDAEEYTVMVDLYKKAVTEWTREDISQFNLLMNKLTVGKAPVSLVRLLGDVLCDRGANDWATLKILARLKELRIPVEIIASNHDEAFIFAYQYAESEGPFLSFGPSHLSKGQDRSMLNTQELLNRFPELSRELEDMVENAYLPTVKLLSYSLNIEAKSITIYTHTPAGLTLLHKIAERLEVPFMEDTLPELTASIDRLNARAEEIGLAALYVTPLEACAEETVLSSSAASLKPAAKVNQQDPFYQLIWNRVHSVVDRPPVSKDGRFGYVFVHGHDHSASVANAGHIINLDGDLGKNIGSDGSELITNHQGVYSALHTKHTQKPEEKFMVKNDPASPPVASKRLTRSDSPPGDPTFFAASPRRLFEDADEVCTLSPRSS